MDVARSATEETKSSQTRKGDEQFPVDIKVTKARIHINETLGDLARGVIMNEQQTAQCSPYQEYFFGDGARSVEDISSFTLLCDSMDADQQAIDGFVGGRTLHINMSQTCAWTCGVYSATAAKKRLYKAVDPGDSTRMIGLLIEQDSRNKLVKLTWYKTSGTGPIFSTAPSSLSFQLVTDQSGAPSLDPDRIGGWTWYYSA